SLTNQLQLRSAKKTYLALVEGRPEPETGSYVSNLIRDRYSNRMKSIERGGKKGVTNYRVVKTLETPAQISLVELELITGRTHQIRAHLSEAGHPLLGDIRYGGKSRLGDRQFTRQCLHSHRLELNHPLSGKTVSFSAEMPEEMDPDNW
ncbi:MAG: RluA family pseudouridine synthase, partial [Desulfocapsaceae bacterium]